MKTIYLEGSLGERFQKSYQLNVHSANEAVYALALQVEGFADYICDKYFELYRGDELIGFNDAEDLAIISNDDVYIIPALEGAGRGGLGKILLSTTLIGASFFIPGANIAGSFAAKAATATMGLGVSLGLTGISTLLAPSPKDTGARERPDANPSFFTDGPRNLTREGAAIPIVFGRCIVGSVITAGSVETQSIGGDTDG